MEGIITMDEGGAVESMNRAAERMFGYPRAEFAGRDLGKLMLSLSHENHDKYLENYPILGGGIGIGREVTGQRKDGSLFPMNLSVSEVILADRRIFTGIIRDAAESKFSQARLEREVLDISAREQRRIGQDLHDDLCQHLAGIQLMTGALADELSVVAPRQAASAGRIGEQIRLTMDRAKMLARGLSPAPVESGGLKAALQELVETSTKLFGVRCVLGSADEGDLSRVDTGAGTHLYRIVQQAITNAVKHGGAKQVRVDVAYGPEEWLLTITDDGAGFSDSQAPGEGMGLRTMKYRAAAIGGSLEIRSSPGQGTIVTCRFSPPPNSG
jgi:PAS domain S-box-containing protein